MRRPLAVGCVAACVLLSAADVASAGPVPPSHQFRGISTVGALFPGPVPEHICTATVVQSPHEDVILTAAHCITGSGAGYEFAPGFHDGISPYGKWKVVAAHAAAGWLRNQDPKEDYVFLDLASRRIDGRERDVQQLTGAITLGRTARRRQWVDVPAYPMGTSANPITCRTRVYLTGPYPSFNCQGYVDGTSGAPWIAGSGRSRRIVGLIGGLHQGGCYSSTSYSSPLGRPAVAAYRAASSGSRGNVLPLAGGDGCG